MFGAEVTWVMRLVAARGDVADLERRIYDSRASRAFCWSGSMMVEVWIWDDDFVGG